MYHKLGTFQKSVLGMSLTYFEAKVAKIPNGK